MYILLVFNTTHMDNEMYFSITVIYFYKCTVYTVPGASLNVSSTHSSGDTFSVGETAVYYTATDPSGNNRTCELIVTVQGKDCYRLTVVHTLLFSIV